MNLKRLTTIAALSSVLTVATIAMAAPAQALAWPTNGWVQVSGVSGAGAIWSMDEYGIRQSWPTMNYTMAQSLSFPNEIYSDGNEYLYCGDTNASDSVITQQDNGDITVDCLPSANTLSPGLTVTLHFRFFAESESGYLARQWAEIHNTSNSTVDLSANPLYDGNVFNTLAWDSATSKFTASDGTTGTTNFADGQVWGVNGDTRGNFIATSAAWGSTCRASDFTVRDQLYFFPADANVIPAGATVNLVTFMNMVFPATNDEAGAAAAYETALAQAKSEYDLGLTGRLVEGLPEGLSVTGWCSPATAAPELPNTGIPSGPFAAGGVASSCLIFLGVLGLVVSRRRSSRS